jgi:peptidoglycan/LPS O-acetylase OafA/YrhL
LDLLRSCGVAVVFLVHLYDIHSGASREGLPWRIGSACLLMFFLHSSYVLMLSLERLKLEGWRLFVSFYLARVFRLYPLSITAVAFAYVFDVRWDRSTLWENLSLTQNLFAQRGFVVPNTIIPIWTLPLEVQMYVLLPALFVTLRNRTAKSVVALWCVAFGLSLLQPALGVRFLLLQYLPCFLGGVLAWRLLRTTTGPRFSGSLFPLALVAVSFIWIAADPERRPFHLAAFGVCLGAAVPMFTEIPWPVVRDVTKIVARYSYGVYLFHFAIEIFFFSNPHYPSFRFLETLALRASEAGRPTRLMLFVALSVLVPFALYHLVEEPGIRVGKRFATWAIGPRSVAVPAKSTA